jgi:Protein of unknown function (DUF4089)
MGMNLEQMIDVMAVAVQLPISMDARPAVVVALQRLAEAAAEVTAFPLSTDVEIAQVLMS